MSKIRDTPRENARPKPRPDWESGAGAAAGPRETRCAIPDRSSPPSSWSSPLIEQHWVETTGPTTSADATTKATD